MNTMTRPQLLLRLAELKMEIQDVVAAIDELDKNKHTDAYPSCDPEDVEAGFFGC